jgi:hypothetical protein
MTKYAFGWKPEPGCSDCADQAAAANALLAATRIARIAGFTGTSLGLFWTLSVVHLRRSHKARELRGEPVLPPTFNRERVSASDERQSTRAPMMASAER